MTYKYKSPLDEGYIRVKVTMAQHKRIFHVRKIRLWASPRYYYNGEYVIVEHLTARWFIALMLLPFLVIGPLMQGIPETWKELKRGIFPHKYGSFSSDRWRLIPEKHSLVEQPIIDGWMKFKMK